MKALRFPFHVHQLDRGNISSKFHHLMHDDRFWAVLMLVLLLALFITMGVLAMRSGVESFFSAPYFYFH